MELDYSGAKNLEEARAIHQAYWDNFHQEVLDGKWIVVPREEAEAHWAAILEKQLKQSKQSNNSSNPTP